MPRRRRSRSIRTYRPLKTMKYSNETVCSGATWTNITNTDPTYPFPIISPSNVMGTRKAKNFTIKASLVGTEGLTGSALCALVYVPEGTNASTTGGLNAGPGGSTSLAMSLYEPSQNVIASWVMTYNTSVPVTVASRLARNLNSNDSIWLLIRPMNNISSDHVLQLNYTCNFALGYN